MFLCVAMMFDWEQANVPPFGWLMLLLTKQRLTFLFRFDWLGRSGFRPLWVRFGVL